MSVDRSTTRPYERWLAVAILVVLVLWRTSIFLVWPQSYFDADQAVFGLMAKHISEGRAFPVFMYGQSYILAVEAWLAAPLFLVFGASATLLKLPLLFVNLAVALLALRLLERDAGLRPLAAVVPILFFALPAPGTSAYLLEPSGGNLEPFLYVLLIWTTRHRPTLCGAILGLAFLHREFSIYGLVALGAIQLADRSFFSRDTSVRNLKILRTAAEVWLVVQFVKQYASAAGPGTSVADLYSAPNNLAELFNRTCVDPRTLVPGVVRMAAAHWPMLFGTTPMPLAEFSIESGVSQGLPGAGLLLVAAVAVLAIGAGWGIAARRWRAGCTICVYMILIGALSVAGYAAGRCGVVERGTMRYELLSILGLVGLGGLFLAVAPSKRLRAAGVALMVAFTGVAAIGHTRLTVEYARHRPIGQKELLVRHVEARGIRYGHADYWTAYYVSFATNERTILASSDFIRVKTYEWIVAEHAAEAVRISRQDCEGGRRLTEYFVLCRP